MKLKLFILCNALLLAWSPILMGQELQEYLPKSPEAAAMDKFVDIPPGSYTGVAGYSVPLYTIQVDGYAIPISLNYHGMGIKVSDVATSVGLGWSLSIGGISLSRQVMGTNDNDINQIDIAQTILGNFQPNASGHSDRLMALGFVNGTHELAPDYYSYALLNNSGKFIFDNLGDAQTVPKDDVAVIGSQGTVLVDNQGIEYRFLEQFDNFS